MSNTVDSRVVEMRFDNKQFESNVATSMSTLDKLKEKLKLTESSKHLNEIGNASKNLDFTSAINGVSALEKRFSVLGIAGMTVIQNLTNSAIRLGGKLTNWFTGGVVQGGITRAMNLEKARFQLQGILKDTQKVKDVMDNVDTSVKGTAYSLDQAAVVASMFAATGMEAGDKMLGALRAVAGTAATTSADYQRVGLIFTQISGQGRVMGNDLLQLSNLGINAAATLGKEFGKTEAEIREMVSKGQVSFEMFAEAMDNAFGAHAAKANATFTGSMANVKAALARIGEDFVAPLVVENGPFVKFFNVLRERINEIDAAIGPIAKTFTDFVSTIANAATKYLGKLDFSKPFEKFKGLEKGFKKLSKTINTIISPVKKVKENVEKVTAPIDKATKSLKALGDIADDVILGKFGNGQERFDKLAKAGYNYCEVQNKVNEKLGCSVRYSKEQIDAQNKLLGSQEKTTSSTEKTEKATTKLTKAQKNQIKKLAKMTEEQARANGCTEEQIEALKELGETAEKLGMPLDEFIDKMDKINGRWLLIDSFKNIGKSIATIFKSIGSAFGDVFSPMKAQGLFNLIAAFHKLSTKLVITDEYADKLKRTFRGLFAAIDIVGRVLGGGLRIGLAIVGTILRAFGATALDVTASLGDLIYKFDEWIKKNDPITKFIELLAEKLGPIAEKVKEFIESLKTDEKASENFKKIAEGLESIWTIVHGGISKTLTSGFKLLQAVLGLFGTSLGDILGKVAVLVTKFGDWIDKNTFITNTLGKLAEIIALVVEGITNLAKNFVALEPVQKMIEGIKNAFSGLGDVFNFSFNGSAIESLYNFIKKLFENIEDWINGLDESKTFQKGLNVVEGLANGIASGIGKVIEAIKSVAKGLIDAFCSLLGIHSPSLVFFAIGGYIISGLLLGLKYAAPDVYKVIQDVLGNLFTIVGDVLQNGLPKIYEFIKLLGSKLYDSFGEFDMQLNELFVAGSIIAVLLLVKKALNIAETLSKPIAGASKVLDNFAGLLKSADKYLSAARFRIIAEAVKTLAIALAILAGTIFILSRIETADLIKASLALTYLVGIVAVLALIATKANKLENFSFAKLSLLMLSLGVTLKILTSCMKTIAELDPDDSERALVQLTALIVALMLVVAAFGNFVKDPLQAMFIQRVGTMLIRMSIAIGLLALTMKMLSSMSWGDIGKASAVIIGALAIFAGFLFLCKFLASSSKYASKVGTMLLRMAVAIGILALVIKLIASISDSDLTRGIAVIAGLELMFAILLTLSMFAGRYARRAGAMFIAMAAAIGILVLTIKTIAEMRPADIAKGLVVIALIMKMFSAILVLSMFAGKYAARAGAMFLLMAGSIMIMAYAVKLMAGLSPEEVSYGIKVVERVLELFALMMVLSAFAGENAGQAGAMMLKMSIAILILVASIAILSILDPADVINGTLCVSLLLSMFAVLIRVTEYAQGCFKTITVLAVVIALLAGSIIALSFLDPNKVAVATSCLAGVMAMFALLSYASKYAAGSLGSLIVMTVAIGMIGGALYLLGQLPCENALAAAGSLSLVLLAMSAALLICSKAMAITPMAIVAMAGMTLILLALVGIFAIMNALNIQPSLEVALALSTLLLAMSGALLILAGVGAVAVPALIGLGTLLLAVTAIGAFITGVGALFNYCTGLEGILDKGIDILCKISYGIGKFIGSIVGGLAEGVTSGLPAIGQNLSAFMVGAKPFLEGLKNVDASTAEAAKNLAVAILAITGAGILDAIAGWVTGKSSMSSFASQLTEFGKGMKAYADTVSGIDTASITASAEAARALTKVANNLPKEGGVWQALAGQQDMASFGSKLKAFGKGMKDYAAQVAGIDVEAISSSANAAKALTKVANNLPKEGGVWQVLAGQQDISSFGSKLKAFGKGMKDYGAQVAGVDTEAISASAKAAKALTKVANNIPKDGGIWQKIAGGKDISSFGKKLKSFGKGIKDYGEAVSGINASAIDASVSAAKKIMGVIKSTSGIDTGGVKKFVNAVDKLGETDMDSVASAFSGAQTTSKMVSAGVKMVKSVGSGIKSSSASVKSSAKSVADSIASSFRSQASSMKSAGTSLVKALTSSLNKASGVKSAGKSLVTKVKNGVDANKKSMTTAGKNLGDGLVAGIRAKYQAAYNAGFKLGQKAVQGEKDGQKSKSPSKETIKAGKWLGEGLIIGIKRMGSSVYNAGYSMGERATESISSALSSVGALIDSDMDIQPTIAPVMDLSNVEAGAGAINGLFSNGIMLGANANLAAINYGMSRNQNGVNEDVVSAIDKLRKDLSKTGGDSYHINGITYDDGSNVADAIKTIVRAAKVERRI